MEKDRKIFWVILQAKPNDCVMKSRIRIEFLPIVIYFYNGLVLKEFNLYNVHGPIQHLKALIQFTQPQIPQCACAIIHFKLYFLTCRRLAILLHYLGTWLNCAKCGFVSVCAGNVISVRVRHISAGIMSTRRAGSRACLFGCQWFVCLICRFYLSCGHNSCVA